MRSLMQQMTDSMCLMIRSTTGPNRVLLIRPADVAEYVERAIYAADDAEHAVQ